MSTRLEKAERAAKAGKLKPAFHRQIIIEERNKQIRALQAKRREAASNLRWALAALDLVRNGLRNKHGLKETDDPSTCDTELWNLRSAKASIEASLK